MAELESMNYGTAGRAWRREGGPVYFWVPQKKETPNHVIIAVPSTS